MIKKIFIILIVISGIFMVSISEGEWLMNKKGLRARLIELEEKNNWLISGLGNREIIKISIKDNGKMTFPFPIAEGKDVAADLSSNINGSKFVFWRTEKFQSDFLYIVDKDGSNLKKVFQVGRLKGSGVSFFYSINKIIFSFGDNNEKTSLVTLNLDTNEVENITNDFDARWDFFSFSPVEKSIVYEAENQKISIMNISTKEKRILTDGKTPSWSPNGKKIAYIGTDYNIYIINPDGAQKELIVKGKGSIFEYLVSIGNVRGPMLWSPDNNFLMYFKEAGIDYAKNIVYIIDIHTKETIKFGTYYFKPSIWINQK